MIFYSSVITIMHGPTNIKVTVQAVKCAAAGRGQLRRACTLRQREMKDEYGALLE
jgi:hypothetical protein